LGLFLFICWSGTHTSKVNAVKFKFKFQIQVLKILILKQRNTIQKRDIFRLANYSSSLLLHLSSPNTQSINQSINQSTGQLNNQPTKQPTYEATSQPAKQRANQPINQQTNQSTNQTINYGFAHKLFKSHASLHGEKRIKISK